MADIVCPLKEAVQISGKEPAIVQGSNVVLYSQLDIFVSATAEKLIGHGVQPGDVVMLRLEHRIRSVILLLACIRIQAAACPIHPNTPSDHIRQQMNSIRGKLLIDDFPWDESEAENGFHRLHSDEVLGMVVEDMALKLNDHISLNQPATAVFTSGSSGEGKAVLHTYGNHYYSALGANPALKLKSHCKWLLHLPLYHVSGLGVIFRCLKAGATMVMPEGDEELVDLLAREQITHMSVVPTHLHRYLQDKNMVDRLKTLTVLLVGGAPVSTQLIQQCLGCQIPIHTCYGLTESASLITLATPAQLEKDTETLGDTLRYREYRLDGQGEIWIRGSIRFSGYLKNGETDQPFDSNGWFGTGDVGRMNEQGNVSFVGRQDFMMVSGGENIHPEEIEQALLQLPGVQRAIVVSLGHPEFGQRPVAILERSDDSLTNDQLKESLIEFLPKFKIPDQFVSWPAALEAVDALKAQRKQIQAWADQHLT